MSSQQSRLALIARGQALAHPGDSVTSGMYQGLFRVIVYAPDGSIRASLVDAAPIRMRPGGALLSLDMVEDAQAT